MSDTLTKFTERIELFPKASDDLNIVFSISYAEYTTYIKLLEALLIGHTIIKSDLLTAATSLDNNMYSGIIDGLDMLNSTLSSILPSGTPSKMNVNVGVVGDLLSVACTDYFGSIPESLFNIFQDIKNGINSNSSIDLGGLKTLIANDLISFKDDIIEELIGSDTFSSILNPLINYENFLKENGIEEMLVRMEKLENCLTKAGIANRPATDFIHPVSKILYSIHYRNLFMINSEGKLDIKSLGISEENQSKMYNVLSNMDIFRLEVTFD